MTDKRRFRYADLQLQSLLERSLLLDTDIDQTLSALPPTLNETYDNILRQINPSHWRLAGKTLRWMVVAHSLPVLRQADGGLIKSFPGEFNGDWWVRRVSGLSSVEIVILLRHLVVLENPRDRTAAGLTSTAACNEDNEDNEDELVFAHFSVMEYLTTPEYMASELRPTFAIDRGEARSKAGSIFFWNIYFMTSGAWLWWLFGVSAKNYVTDQ